MTQSKAIAPPIRRQFLSFSLRTLLATIGVCAVLCFWFAAGKYWPSKRQERAVKQLLELGVPLVFDYQIDKQGNRNDDAEVNGPKWVRNIFGDDFVRRVHVADLAYGNDDKHGDATLALFADLPDVRTLELGGNIDITDDGLKHLANMQRLKTLYLYRTSVTGWGFEFLSRCRELEYLNCSKTPLTDEALPLLAPFDRLKFLSLNGTDVTDAGLARLPRFRALENLRIDFTKITDAGLEFLKDQNGIASITLQGARVTSQGVARLKQALPRCRISSDAEWREAIPAQIPTWPSDQHPSRDALASKIGEIAKDGDIGGVKPDQPIVALRLFDASSADQCIVRVLDELPDLTILNMRNVLWGDGLAAALPRLKNLQVVNFDNSRLTDAGLASLAKIQNLTELSVENTLITDEGLEQLKQCHSLKVLRLGNNRISYKAIRKLRAEMPHCRVWE